MCKSKNRYFFTTFRFPWGRPWGNHAKCCMDGKRIGCLQSVSQHVPIYLQQFASYSNCKCKKIAIFTYSSRHFCFPWRRPATITQYVASMERQFNACQMARSMYLSTFNNFWLIRCLSQCVSPKNRYFYHIFVFPGDAPGAITLNIVWFKRECDAYKLSSSSCSAKNKMIKLNCSHN